MEKTKRPLVGATPPTAWNVAKLPTRPANYRAPNAGGLARTVDGTGRDIGEAVPVRGAKRLTQVLGGQWLEAGSAPCPVCHTPGMVITQDSSGTVSVACPENCDPASIHAALLNLGFAVTEMWVS
jgi:hypothetical protein